MSKNPRTLRALVDLTYGPLNVEVKAGEITTSLPAESVTWLLTQGLVVEVSAPAPTHTSPVLPLPSPRIGD